MPARIKSKSRLARRRKVKRVPKVTLGARKFVYFTVILVVIVAFTFLNFSTKFWDGKYKLSIVSPSENGEVHVMVFDPILDEITTIIIPSETEIPASRQLGKWRVKSLWQLGQDENMGGKLLVESLTYHMKFPVDAWADYHALGFASQDLRKIWMAAFFTTNTNLTLGDKVGLAMFSMGVQNSGNTQIDLANTTYLKRSILQDGENGYSLAGSVPQSVVVVFSKEKLSKNKVNVRIVDRTESMTVADELGRVIQVTGGKVASIVNEESQEMDCEVSGRDSQIVRFMSDLFDCKQIDMGATNFDIEIRIGNLFAERF